MGTESPMHGNSIKEQTRWPMILRLILMAEDIDVNANVSHRLTQSGGRRITEGGEPRVVGVLTLGGFGEGEDDTGLAVCGPVLRRLIGGDVDAAAGGHQTHFQSSASASVWLMTHGTNVS